LLGHSSISTTEIYTNLNLENIKDEVIGITENMEIIKPKFLPIQ
jgi:hypothetical protein